MQNFDNKDKSHSETLFTSLMLLVFGLGVLGFLVAIDHPEWFRLRPASGTAAAMAQAAAPPAPQAR
jgi:hypothetical protein